MAFPPIISLLILCNLLFLNSTANKFSYQQNCPQSFPCGNKSTNLSFPFASILNPLCGLVTVNCTNQTVPSIYFHYGEAFDLIELSTDSVTVHDDWLAYLIHSRSCETFFNHTISNSPSISFSVYSQNLTIFKCINASDHVGNYFRGFHYHNCSQFDIYYSYPDTHQFSLEDESLPENCEAIQIPLLSSKDRYNVSDVFSLLGADYSVRLRVSDNCTRCRQIPGQCVDNQQTSVCVSDEDKGRLKHLAPPLPGRTYLKVILVTVISGCIVLIIIMAILTIRYRKKWKDSSKYIPSRNMSSDPSSNTGLEGFLFGVHEFSYAELEEATNGFDSSRELGDGGFGTVYYGKLRDGREVAVKRLYEHNYKRMTQFRNEIEILTRLHHKNLVILYGCTSRQSRELLLVYEYIPNGTVDDHLHGDLAKDKPLTWHDRINIAIETASALSYLHKSDVIHRDVKTNNILLDNNFSVKVADFGLSRLFPNDVTHVSTAPQGTPGYVDPDYHHCYQLTDKSDVYSFGVVLIELISSMPVIDVNRNKYEINLANFAMNRIQNRDFGELIDPSLGFESDPVVERMMSSVAEVAFRCLQLEKDMRPSMDEVLDTLRDIRDYKEDTNEKEMITNMRHRSLEADHAVLLKMNKVPLSPNSMSNKWVSSSNSFSSG